MNKIFEYLLRIQNLEPQSRFIISPDELNKNLHFNKIFS